VGDGEDTELLDLLQGDGTRPRKTSITSACAGVTMRALLKQTAGAAAAMCMKMRYGMDVAEPMSLTLNSPGAGA